mmetsp:Transcript_28543/g.75582  ORF Transcript_28543/g.75582 Transcript_28543/m.75582 type:complete len:332 (-) Transcript_28543:226-1221(-)
MGSSSASSAGWSAWMNHWMRSQTLWKIWPPSLTAMSGELPWNILSKTRRTVLISDWLLSDAKVAWSEARRMSSLQMVWARVTEDSFEGKHSRTASWRLTTSCWSAPLSSHSSSSLKDRSMLSRRSAFCWSALWKSARQAWPCCISISWAHSRAASMGFKSSEGSLHLMSWSGSSMIQASCRKTGSPPGIPSEMLFKKALSLSSHSVWGSRTSSFSSMSANSTMMSLLADGVLDLNSSAPNWACFLYWRMSFSAREVFPSATKSFSKKLLKWLAWTSWEQKEKTVRPTSEDSMRFWMCSDTPSHSPAALMTASRSTAGTSRPMRSMWLESQV